MHGIIFVELKKYVTARHGAAAWRTVLRGAGLPAAVYLPVAAYPDERAAAIVGAASEITGTPALEIMEDFGRSSPPTCWRCTARW